MINRWIGPGSDVGLSQDVIRSLYGLILSVTAEINTTSDTRNLTSSIAFVLYPPTAMKRSLHCFSSTAGLQLLCQTAEASSTYTAPEQLTGAAKANSIEARIEAVRNTDWGSLLPSRSKVSWLPRASGATARAEIRQQPRQRQVGQRQERQQVEQ